MKKVIVFNCHYNGLAIIQELGSKGVNCVAMDSKRGIGTYSKFAKYVQVSNPAYNEDDFINELYGFCEKEGNKPVLFPTNDHWAMAISKWKLFLSKVAIPIVCDYETIKVLIEKNIFYSLGEKHDFNTPKTWIPSKVDEILKTDFPIIAKPEYRRNSNIKYSHEQLDRLRFTVINNNNELKSFCSKYNQMLSDFVFQEYIPGDSSLMYTLGIYANNSYEFGNNYFWGKKIRGYPAEYGDWVVGESRNVLTEVLEKSRAIVKLIKYSGIAELEFKYDKKNNQYRLIEINPRSWSWVGITQFTGDGLATAAYQDKTGEKLKSKTRKTNKTIRYAKLLEDLHFSFWKYRKEYPSWKKNVFQLIKDYRGKKTYFVEFMYCDYKVALMAVYRKMKEILKN